jgi:hypothetical protein
MLLVLIMRLPRLKEGRGKGKEIDKI